MSFFYVFITHGDFAILAIQWIKQHALWRIRSLSCQHSDKLNNFSIIR